MAIAMPLVRNLLISIVLTTDGMVAIAARPLALMRILSAAATIFHVSIP
jgi:hypothetical protein